MSRPRLLAAVERRRADRETTPRPRALPLVPPADDGCEERCPACGRSYGEDCDQGEEPDDAAELVGTDQGDEDSPFAWRG